MPYANRSGKRSEVFVCTRDGDDSAYVHVREVQIDALLVLRKYLHLVKLFFRLFDRLFRNVWDESAHQHHHQNFFVYFFYLSGFRLF